MELDAFDFVAAVAEAHDDAVVGFSGNDEFAGQGFSLDDQGMVARGREGIRELAENIFVVVMDLARLAVKKFRGTDDFAAERGANGLVAETDPQNGELPSKTLDQFHGNTGFLGSTRTGGNYDAFGLAADNFFDRNFVVAMDFDLATQFAEILREVVSERVVVVEKQDHDGVLVP